MPNQERIKKQNSHFAFFKLELYMKADITDNEKVEIRTLINLILVHSSISDGCVASLALKDQDSRFNSDWRRVQVRFSAENTCQQFETAFTENVRCTALWKNVTLVFYGERYLRCTAWMRWWSHISSESRLQRQPKPIFRCWLRFDYRYGCTESPTKQQRAASTCFCGEAWIK